MRERADFDYWENTSYGLFLHWMSAGKYFAPLHLNMAIGSEIKLEFLYDFKRIGKIELIDWCKNDYIFHDFVLFIFYCIMFRAMCMETRLAPKEITSFLQENYIFP